MTKNAYFQLEEKENKVYLRIFPEQGEGKKAETEDIVRYFEAISWEEYDLVLLDAYVKKGEYETPLYIKEGEMIPERERVLVDIAEDAMVARARFYPPSTGGSSMTEDEIISDLQLAGICHGIRRKAIRHFLENHEYCRDYIIAEATKPIQGSDAQIEYFFDVNATAKPKLNEDGSVDFHHLGNIKLVEKGDKLAALKPAVKGVPGINVLGKPIPANKVKIKHPIDAMNAGIGLITEDRRGNGIFGCLSIKDNVGVSVYNKFLKAGFVLDHKKINQVVDDSIKKLSIKTPSMKEHIANLSGGNQQKVIVARWLANDPDVLIMDEPTRGIDVGAKYEIYQIMIDLVKQGKSIIMISSEMPELIGMSNRIIVMCNGHITGEVEGEDATQEKIMSFATKFTLSGKENK